MTKKIRLLGQITLLLTAVVFFGCRGEGSGEPSTSAMDELDKIDALIKQGQKDEALKALDTLQFGEGFFGKIKLMAKGLTPWTALGVYRRYELLGENKKAVDLLKKSVEHNKGNVELSAVYTNYLLDRANYYGNTIDETVKNDEWAAQYLKDALKVGKCLKGTQYGALYSEALLKDSLRRLLGEDNSEYISRDYLPIYMDAHKATGNNQYLRNAALIYLACGEYGEAFSLRPEEAQDEKDAYFWALVSFDNKSYGDAVAYLKALQEFVMDKGLTAKDAAKSLDYVRAISLEADAYTALKEEDEAQKLRRNFISSLEYKDGEWILPYSEDDGESIFSAIFVNAARFSFDNNDWDGCADYITFAVNRWPDFVSALSLYANFAYESNKAREENLIQRQIRAAKLTTLEMEEFDNRPRVPISDALYRIDESLKRTNNPILHALSLDLKFKIDKTLTVEDKEREIWRVLEDNMIMPGVYPEAIFDYAVNFMLKNKKRADAWYLYRASMSKIFSIPLPEVSEKNRKAIVNDEILKTTAQFLNAIYDKEHEINQTFLEYAAYFAATFGLKSETKKLYEAVCESGLKTTNFTLINMALIYQALNEDEKALDTLEKTVGRCTNMVQKSLVMYRIAKLYYESGDIKNAKRSVEYAITLNNRNADARLLLGRIATSQDNETYGRAMTPPLGD